MTAPLPLGIVVGLLCCACGSGQSFLAGGLCGAAAAATNGVTNKLQNCAAAESSTQIGDAPCFDPVACENNVKSCSAADEEILRAVISCQNTYANNSDCSFAGLTTYGNCATQVATLSDGGSALSPACANQFATNLGNCAPVDGGE